MSDLIQIRPARMQDYEGVSRIFEDENKYHAQVVPDRVIETKPLLDVDWYQSVLSSSNDHIAVAFDRNGLLGLVFMQIKESEKEPFFVQREYLYVQDLAVVEAARGKGIGKLLMDYTRDFAKQRELAEIQLHVWEANKSAIAFYQKDGFTLKRRMMIQTL